jgi:hypothetical protein
MLGSKILAETPCIHMYFYFLLIMLLRVHKILDWEGVGNHQLLCFFKA